MMSSWHRSLVATLLVVLSLAAGACGIATDETPTALPDGVLIDVLRPDRLPTPVQVIDGFNAQIFLVGSNDRLSIVPRKIDLIANPETQLEVEQNARVIIAELLLGETRLEASAGIENAIPRDTDLQSVSFEPTTKNLLVNLTAGSFERVVGDEQRIALGQFVFSLTLNGTIEGVSFSIGGDLLPVQTDSGLTARGAAVTPADLASLDPSAAPQISLGLPEDTDVVDEESSTTVASDNLIDVQVWMVNTDDQLVAVARRLERTPEALLAAIAVPTTAGEFAQGVRTALTNPAASIDVDVFDDSNTFRTAFVDFDSGQLPDVTDPNRLLAAAQIVFTLTGLAEIDQVAFSIDGEFTAMETIFGLSPVYERGVTRGIDRTDYAPLAPEGTPLIVLPSEEPSTADPTVVSEPDPTATPDP